MKEFAYTKLYWFLTRKPLVKVALLILAYIAALACFLIVYSVAVTPSRASAPEQVVSSTPQATATLPPTYTPAPRTAPMDIKSKMGIALSDYDYLLQQVQIEEVKVEGQELVVRLRRHGTPSTEDYFGQLDIILSVIAQEKLEVNRVRTIDVDDQTGFIISMEHLLEFHNDNMEYDEYRNLWEYFES
jgi:hypothetical protein